MSAFEILLPLALILSLTKLLGLGSQKVGLPAVIGMLIAGLLIGLLKNIHSDAIDYIFFSEDIKEWLSVFAKVGVVLIMFSTGLGTDLKQLKSTGFSSVVITTFGVLVPMALGTLVAWAFGEGDGFLGHLFYGAILTATSVSVTVAALKELGKLNTKVGTSIVAAAVIDDVIGIIILSVLTGFTPQNGGNAGAPSFLPEWWENAAWWLVCLKILIFFVIAVGLGILLRKLFNKIERKYPHNRRVPILALGTCFVYAYVAEKIFGVADITGAYVAGIMLGELRDSLDARGLTFDWDDSLVDSLVKKSYSVQYGARNLRRTIQKDLEDPIAEKLIDAYQNPLHALHAKADGERVTLESE